MLDGLALLLGHCVGDYWFQSNKIALNKSKDGPWGSYWCTLHCAIYSICVALFVVFGGWEYSSWVADWFRIDLTRWEIVQGNFFIAFLIAYVTHYPIDRISFASKWMKWFGIVDFEKAPPTVETHEIKDGFGNLGWSDGKVNIRSFFVAPIYIIIDNSMHLVLMWILFELLGK